MSPTQPFCQENSRAQPDATDVTTNNAVELDSTLTALSEPNVCSKHDSDIQARKNDVRTDDARPISFPSRNSGSPPQAMLDALGSDSPTKETYVGKHVKKM